MAKYGKNNRCSYKKSIKSSIKSNYKNIDCRLLIYLSGVRAPEGARSINRKIGAFFVRGKLVFTRFFRILEIFNMTGFWNEIKTQLIIKSAKNRGGCNLVANWFFRCKKLPFFSSFKGKIHLRLYKN